MFKTFKLALTACAMTTTAFGALIVEYNFNLAGAGPSYAGGAQNVYGFTTSDASFSASSTAVNITATQIQGGTNMGDASNGGQTARTWTNSSRYADRNLQFTPGYDNGNIPAANANAHFIFSAGNYIRFSVTVSPGQQLDLSSLTLLARRATTDDSSVRYLAIRSDRTGTTDLYNSAVSAVRPGGTGNAFNFGADAVALDLTSHTTLQGVTGTVSFYIATYNTMGADGSVNGAIGVELNDIQLHGTVSASSELTITAPFPGYVLTFEDQFTGEVLSDGRRIYDRTKWSGRLSPPAGLRNNEAQAHVDDAETFLFGTEGSVDYLSIVARRRSVMIGNQTFHYTAGELRGGDPQAGIDLFSQRRGYWEIRARMPAPADGSSDIGFWPAFWLLPSDPGLLVPGGAGNELDVFEYLSNWNNTKFSTTMHWDGYGSENKSFGNEHTVSHPPGQRLTESYHTWGLLWDETGYRWYFDGIQKMFYPSSGAGFKDTAPIRMLLTFAIGGNYPNGIPRATSFPAEYRIDYTRVYALASEAGILEFQDPPQSVASGNSAVFRVRRTEGTTGAVSLEYRTQPLEAVAVNHYTHTEGTLHWADGDTTERTIEVPVASGAFGQEARQFYLQLRNPSGGAVIRAPHVSRVSVNYNHFNSWINGFTYLTSTQRTPEAELAGDGLSNLQKYAFGLHPEHPSADQAPQLTQVTVHHGDETQTYLALSYRRRTGGTDIDVVNYIADGILYAVEVSDSLEHDSWTSGSDKVIPHGDPIDNADGTETAVVRLVTPVSTEAPAQFLRLRLSVNELL